MTDRLCSFQIGLDRLNFDIRKSQKLAIEQGVSASVLGQVTFHEGDDYGTFLHDALKGFLAHGWKNIPGSTQLRRVYGPVAVRIYFSYGSHEATGLVFENGWPSIGRRTMQVGVTMRWWIDREEIAEAQLRGWRRDGRLGRLTAGFAWLRSPIRRRHV